MPSQDYKTLIDRIHDALKQHPAFNLNEIKAFFDYNSATNITGKREKRQVQKVLRNSRNNQKEKDTVQLKKTAVRTSYARESRSAPRIGLRMHTSSSSYSLKQRG